MRYHDDIIPIVNNFAKGMAEKSQSSDYYAENRNASNPILDISIGKYGEFASCYLLRVNGFPPILPDVEIKDGFQKSWDCDLPFGELNNLYPNCGVKSCDQKTSNFVSNCTPSKYTWTFQYKNTSGRGGRDKLFDTPDSNEIILFVFVPDLTSKMAILIASAPWNKIQSIIEEPIASKFKGYKKCIYSEDLKQLALLGS